jgi:hypothetical protein
MTQIYQIEILERNGRLVYKEVGDVVRLVMKYGEIAKVIELAGDILRVYKEGEGLLVAVKLKPRVAAKLRKYMLRINTAVEISVLWFELERAVIYVTPKGADIRLWRLDLDEPNQKKRRSIAQILSNLKSLFP